MFSAKGKREQSVVNHTRWLLTSWEEEKGPTACLGFKKLREKGKVANGTRVRR